MITVVPIMKAAPGWSPPPFQAPALRRGLGQTVTTTPTTPPGSVVMVPGIEPPKPAFIDSALVSAIMSGLGATSYGFLSYAFGKAQRQTWSKIFFGVSAVLGAKFLYDVYNIRTR
jgi:hypothetical protein